MPTDGEFTEDAILGGRVILKQPKRGYRVNVDTVLLAAAVDVRAGQRVVELGCGVGAAILALAKLEPGARFAGIERDPLYAKLARENATRNGVDVEIVEADALDPALALGQFDRVLLNPPYDDPSEGRAPSPERRAAHVSERPIEDWVKLWSNRMAGDASFTMIHRAAKLDEIIAALEGRLGGMEIMPIRPNAAEPAHRVIVRAWKGSRAPLKLYRGLDLHPEAASAVKYTAEADAILRGQAPLWPG